MKEKDCWDEREREKRETERRAKEREKVENLSPQMRHGQMDADGSLACLVCWSCINIHTRVVINIYTM